MHSIIEKFRVFSSQVARDMVVFAAVASILVFVATPTTTFAFGEEYDCCSSYFDTPSYNYYDTPSYSTYDTPAYSTYDTPSYNYYDTPSYSTYDTPAYSTYDTPSYNYYDTAAYDYYDTPSYNYYDTPAYNYYDTSTYGGYGGNTASPIYSYGSTGGYGGNTASPIYSYGTPSYGGIGGYGGYSTGGGYYVEPIPTWPSTPHFTATPSYGTSYNNNNQYVDNTPIPTWPSNMHITASASAVGTATGGNANQEQQQYQTNHQANSQTNSQTQNNPVTVTQSQGPINNSNTNINNITIPAPVYQAPNQFSVNYNFAEEYQMPTCTISVSNSYYNSYSNNPVTLTWSSTKAFSASITPNVGTVNPNGSTTVYPTGGTTIYTLTVHGQGGSNTCQTQVIYQAQPPVYQPPVYIPPKVTPPPYVALTQIPYTGFDFGPVGNSIYWAGLLSFALAAAYLVIYYKGGLAFATGTIGTRRSTPRAEKTAKTIVSAEAPVAKTPTSMFADLPTREYRNSTADTMNIKLAQNADEMPRITITRA